MRPECDADVIFVGGGLASGLAAYRLHTRHPDVRITILEAGAEIGGNHTWSYHATDISPTQDGWVKPFQSASWAAQSVAFPARTRHLSTGYRSIASGKFHDVLTSLPDIDIRFGQVVDDTGPTHVTTRGGDRWTARVVFDGRGAQPSPHLDIAFQKFLGCEIEFAEPHGLTEPIIMDATVPQTDGYRFVYTLPLSANTALIEDTYYADGADLPRDGLRREIEQYAHGRGWRIKNILREEDGVLPIVLGGDHSAFWRAFDGHAVPIGLRAALFHPVTGYSVPDAVRIADLIATTRIDAASMGRAISSYAAAQWKAHQFYRVLNRMLFRAGRPEKRYIVLQRHYGLSQGLIERFYAGRSTVADKIRILAGKPPVPIFPAVKAILKRHDVRIVEKGYSS